MKTQQEILIEAEVRRVMAQAATYRVSEENKQPDRSDDIWRELVKWYLRGC